MSGRARQPVLFVQGAGDMWEPEGSGVLAQYLDKSLGAGYHIIAPEMPDAATEPHYRPWRDLIDAKLRAINEPVVLVGHSLGGSVLLRYLAEGPPPVPIAGLFLASMPWWGPEGWAYEEYAPPADFATKLPAIPTFLYHSREDPHVPFDHLALYEEQLHDATSRPIVGAEHSFTKGLPAMVDDIRQVTR